MLLHKYLQDVVFSKNINMSITDLKKLLDKIKW